MILFHFNGSMLRNSMHNIFTQGNSLLLFSSKLKEQGFSFFQLKHFLFRKKKLMPTLIYLGMTP